MSADLGIVIGVGVCAIPNYMCHSVIDLVLCLPNYDLYSHQCSYSCSNSHLCWYLHRYSMHLPYNNRPGRAALDRSSCTLWHTSSDISLMAICACAGTCATSTRLSSWGTARYIGPWTTMRKWPRGWGRHGCYWWGMDIMVYCMILFQRWALSSFIL